MGQLRIWFWTSQSLIWEKGFEDLDLCFRRRLGSGLMAPVEVIAQTERVELDCVD